MSKQILQPLYITDANRLLAEFRLYCKAALKTNFFCCENKINELP